MTDSAPLVLELKEINVMVRREEARPKCLLNKNLSLTLAGGELIVILGDSGAGKSTLLQVIAGFLEHQSHIGGLTGRVQSWFKGKSQGREVVGHVLINGEDMCDWEPRDRPVGLVMQRFNLYPHMSVRQNLEFPLKMRGLPAKLRKELAERIAERLNIAQYLKQSAEVLSGGEAQRVAIGKMLLREPKVALLDEAFSHLDPELRQKLRQNVIEEFLSADGSSARGIIFVSHDLADAERATEIVILDNDSNGDKEKITKFEQVRGVGEKTAWDVLQNMDNVDIQKLIQTIPKLKAKVTL
jgi:multiple sugar transport system ATP-binding protein